MIQMTGQSVPSLGTERFFSGMPRSIVERLDTYAWHRQYEPRQIIFFPDDACDYVYWVRFGRVKITRVSESGREISFRHLISGDMFGEECLVNSQQHNDYAEAITPTLLSLVRSDDFLRIMREEGEFCHAVATYLCRRTLDVENVLSEFVFIDVRQRVASRLWHMYLREEHNQDVSLYVTHQDVANLAGAARETVTTVLNRLKRDGVIGLGTRCIHILKPGALRRLAELGE